MPYKNDSGYCFNTSTHTEIEMKLWKSTKYTSIFAILHCSLVTTCANTGIAHYMLGKGMHISFATFGKEDTHPCCFGEHTFSIMVGL